MLRVSFLCSSQTQQAFSVKVPLFFFQGSLQEQDDSEPDSSLSQSPNVQDWLSQARSTRTQQHHDNLLRQRVREI